MRPQRHRPHISRQHIQLAINLALFGSLSIIVAHHMYAMPPYPYLATDYSTQLGRNKYYAAPLC